MWAVSIWTLAAGVAAGQGNSRTKAKTSNNGKLALDQPTPQAPAIEADLPAAVTADAARLSFQVSPLSSKGLLLQQTRDALKALEQANHGGRIVKLRAFVGGTADARRVRQIVTDAFTEKKQPKPVLTTVQAGELPKDGAQIVIESVSEDTGKRPLNPGGLVFFAPLTAEGDQAVANLAAAAKQAGVESFDMLSVTCFLGSTETATAVQAAAARAFPKSALDMIPRLRANAGSSAACEGVARGKQAAAGKLVFSGAQMAFGETDADLRLAFERLKKSLEPLGVTSENIVAAGFYPVSRAAEQKLAGLNAEFFHNPALVSHVIFEGLPSPDASVSMDVVAAVPASAGN